MSMIGEVVEALIVIPCFIVIFLFAPRLILDYEFDALGVRVVLFGRYSIMFVPLADITEVQIVKPFGPCSANPFTTISFKNRIWMWNDGVMIRRRRGFFRNVFITPEDPQAFVDYLNRWMVETKPPE